MLDRALEVTTIPGGVVRFNSPEGTQHCYLVASSSTKKSYSLRYVFSTSDHMTIAFPDSACTPLSIRCSEADEAGVRLHRDKWMYTVILDGPGFCTCPDFANRVLMGGQPRSPATDMCIRVPWQPGAGAPGSALVMPSAHTQDLQGLLSVTAGTGVGIALPNSATTSGSATVEHRRFCKHLLGAKIAETLQCYTPSLAVSEADWLFFLLHEEP